MIHFNCYIHTHIYSIEKNSISTVEILFFFYVIGNFTLPLIIPILTYNIHKITQWIIPNLMWMIYQI